MLKNVWSYASTPHPPFIFMGWCVKQHMANFGKCGQSNTAVSLSCNFSDYVLRNSYMFRPMMAIFRLSWEYLRATVSYIARIM